MAAKTKGVLDDALPILKIPDISGGLNTQDGILDLASNQTFACQNVIGFPKRTIYAGGYELYTALDTGVDGDGGWEYFDSNGAKHLIAWAGGNMYDTVNGTKTTIATNCYIAGQNIGKIDQNGMLYWSTLTVPIQVFNGVTTTPVVSSGGVGVGPIPASDYLCSYAGSIIAANPVISGTQYVGAIIGSNVNDPTSFVTANLTQCGNDNYIRFLIPMGVAAAGIPPTGSIMIGGSIDLILAQGAFNSFKLNEVNLPQGCKDGQSAQYIPTGDLFGAVVYLGNDNQYWWTNGVSGECISLQNLDYFNSLIQSALQYDVLQKFWGGYNAQYQYYYCDLGQNNQLAYRWRQKAWYYLQGWPSGPIINGTSGLGFPTNYTVANQFGALGVAAGVYATGQPNAFMGGSIPAIFYNTAYMHANDPSMTKEWQWATLLMNNVFPASYNVYAVGLANATGHIPVSNTLQFSNPQLINFMAQAEWDVSKWDVGVWGSGGGYETQMPYPASGMLSEPVAASVWLPNGANQPLRSSAVSFNISWTNGGIASALPSFDVLGFDTRFKPMGHYTTGGAQYSAESGANNFGTSYPFQ